MSSTEVGILLFIEGRYLVGVTKGDVISGLRQIERNLKVQVKSGLLNCFTLIDNHLGDKRYSKLHHN